MTAQAKASNVVRTVQFKLPLDYALLKTERLKSKIRETWPSLFVTFFFLAKPHSKLTVRAIVPGGISARCVAFTRR